MDICYELKKIPCKFDLLQFFSAFYYIVLALTVQNPGVRVPLKFCCFFFLIFVNLQSSSSIHNDNRPIIRNIVTVCAIKESIKCSITFFMDIMLIRCACTMLKYSYYECMSVCSILNYLPLSLLNTSLDNNHIQVVNILM